MNKLKEKVRELSNQVDELLSKTDRNLAKLKNLPPLHVQSMRCRGYDQFYEYNQKDKTRKYIKVKELGNYAKIMQRDYEQSVSRKLNKIKKELHKAEKALNQVNLEDVKQMYDAIPTKARKYVVPAVETDKQFVERWKEEHPGGKNPFPEEGNIYTAGGVMVRSKSEKIIAELLEKYQVPYSYEPMLETANYRTFYPDFVVLNVRKKKTLYWEHLGLVDNEEYAVKNWKKILEYNGAGICLGDNLVVSIESENRPLDSRDIERIIQKFCL